MTFYVVALYVVALHSGSVHSDSTCSESIWIKINITTVCVATVHRVTVLIVK